MRKIGLTIIVILLVGLSFWKVKPLNALAMNVLYVSPCDAPLTYKIGNVDQRFNLTDQQFQDDIKQATNIWSTKYGKNLFVFDPKGAITVSMTYDERQSLSNQINTLDTNLNTQKSSLTPQLEEYRQRVAAFKKSLADFNAQVSYWNRHGGAPEDEYNKLQAEQKVLQDESNALSAMVASLNQSTNDYNQEVQQLNSTVNTFNTELVGKPEEGQYIQDENGKRIIIYFNTTQRELIHTLAHEFGHSLGMEHVAGMDSIMYPLTNEITTPSTQDLSELTRVCQKKNVFEILYMDLLLVFPKNVAQN